MTNSELRKSSLSPARRRFVELMSRMQFGRITALDVHAGDPSFGPDSQILTEIHFGKEPAAASPAPSDFALRRQVIEFLDVLDRIGNGRIELVDVKHGLPFRVQFDDSGSFQARAARHLAGIR